MKTTFIEMLQLIVDTFSSIFTCVAFIVAWMTYQKEYAVKLSIDVTDRPVPIGSLESNRIDYGFSITIKNISNRPILVENIGLRVATYGISVMSDVEDVKLDAVDIIRTGIRIPTKEAMKTIWPSSKKISSRRKVYIVVTSSIGRRIIRTKTTLRDLIKLRQQHPDSTILCKDATDYSSLHVNSLDDNNDSGV